MLQTFLPCPSASHLCGSDFAWVMWGWDLSNDSTSSGDVLKEMQFTHMKMKNGTEQVTQACASYSATATAQWCGDRSVVVTARPWDSSGSCSTLHQQVHQLLVDPRAGAENSPWSVAQISTCRLTQLLVKTFHRPVAFIMSWHRDLSLPTYFLSCRALVVFSLSVYQIWFSLSEWGNWI